MAHVCDLTLRISHFLRKQIKSGKLEIAETWKTCHDASGQVYVHLPWLDWPDTTNGAKDPVKSAILFRAP